MSAEGAPGRRRAGRGLSLALGGAWCVCRPCCLNARSAIILLAHTIGAKTELAVARAPAVGSQGAAGEDGHPTCVLHLGWSVRWGASPTHTHSHACAAAVLPHLTPTSQTELHNASSRPPPLMSCVLQPSAHQALAARTASRVSVGASPPAAPKPRPHAPACLPCPAGTVNSGRRSPDCPRERRSRNMQAGGVGQHSSVTMDWPRPIRLCIGTPS